MKRVLVVDDDPTVSEVVAGCLNRAGFAVDVAADGPTAVAKATAQPPALVVLDLVPPGVDGLEVCRRVRRDGPLPVIMLTARGDEEDRVWGWEFGDLSTVTVHVRRLRGKIEHDPARPRLITTVWGVGYRFDAFGTNGAYDAA